MLIGASVGIAVAGLLVVAGVAYACWSGARGSGGGGGLASSVEGKATAAGGGAQQQRGGQQRGRGRRRPPPPLELALQQPQQQQQRLALEDAWGERSQPRPEQAFWLPPPPPSLTGGGSAWAPRAPPPTLAGGEFVVHSPLSVRGRWEEAGRSASASGRGWGVREVSPAGERWSGWD